MRLIDTRAVLGLSFWILGFALMTAGWLVDVLFERFGSIPAKVLYKTGAVIVATPVIYLLWKASRALYVHRIDVILFINDAWKLFEGLSKAL